MINDHDFLAAAAAAAANANQLRVHWLFVGCLTPGPSSGKEYVKHLMPQHYTSTKQATQRRRSKKFTVALILI